MEQRLLPQMLQSIEILQLATADLLQLVSQQMETNEALELAPVAETAELSAQIVDATARAADVLRLALAMQTMPPEYAFRRLLREVVSLEREGLFRAPAGTLGAAAAAARPPSRAPRRRAPPSTAAPRSPPFRSGAPRATAAPACTARSR
jgi:hypothetical protein